MKTFILFVRLYHGLIIKLLNNSLISPLNYFARKLFIHEKKTTTPCFFIHPDDFHECNCATKTRFRPWKRARW